MDDREGRPGELREVGTGGARVSMTSSSGNSKLNTQWSDRGVTRGH
jgi:hypothetical protein